MRVERAATRSAGARVFAAVYPGLTANFDAGRLRALGIAAAQLLDHGAEYAARCIDAARTLGEALDEAGLLVVGADRRFTESHHLRSPCRMR